jgi:hypothetical protein
MVKKFTGVLIMELVDLRLGQYLINKLHPRDIFYVDDEELFMLIDEWKSSREK